MRKIKVEICIKYNEVKVPGNNLLKRYISYNIFIDSKYFIFYTKERPVKKRNFKRTGWAYDLIYSDKTGLLPLIERIDNKIFEYETTYISLYLAKRLILSTKRPEIADKL